MAENAPQPTARITKRLRRHAKKLQALAPRQTPEEQVVLNAPVARALANTCWQAAGRLEDALAHVRLFASSACAGIDQEPDETTLWTTPCGQCGPCHARQFLNDAGDQQEIT